VPDILGGLAAQLPDLTGCEGNFLVEIFNPADFKSSLVVM
jgi:hypothetical protein